MICFFGVVSGAAPDDLHELAHGSGKREVSGVLGQDERRGQAFCDIEGFWQVEELKRVQAETLKQKLQKNEVSSVQKHLKQDVKSLARFLVGCWPPSPSQQNAEPFTC